jgi:hypothetical protein
MPAAARRGEPNHPQAADNNGSCRLRCPGPVFSSNRSRTGDARFLRRARQPPSECRRGDRHRAALFPVLHPHNGRPADVVLTRQAGHGRTRRRFPPHLSPPARPSSSCRPRWSGVTPSAPAEAGTEFNGAMVSGRFCPSACFPLTTRLLLITNLFVFPLPTRMARYLPVRTAPFARRMRADMVGLRLAACGSARVTPPWALVRHTCVDGA